MKAHWTQWAMLFVLVTVVAFLFLGDRACGQEVLAPPNDQARPAEGPKYDDLALLPEAPYILPYRTFEPSTSSWPSCYTLANTQQIFCELSDAPQPVKCQTVSLDADGKLKYTDVDCGKFPVQWRAMPALAPKRHSWAYRHPVILGTMAGGTFALIWGLTHRDSCPSYVSGVPYNGTKPCPSRCDKDGCYWGPK